MNSTLIRKDFLKFIEDCNKDVSIDTLRKYIHKYVLEKVDNKEKAVKLTTFYFLLFQLILKIKKLNCADGMFEVNQVEINRIKETLENIFSLKQRNVSLDTLISSMKNIISYLNYGGLDMSSFSNLLKKNMLVNRSFNYDLISGLFADVIYKSLAKRFTSILLDYNASYPLLIYTYERFARHFPQLYDIDFIPTKFVHVNEIGSPLDLYVYWIYDLEPNLSYNLSQSVEFSNLDVLELFNRLEKVLNEVNPNLFIENEISILKDDISFHTTLLLPALPLSDLPPRIFKILPEYTNNHTRIALYIWLKLISKIYANKRINLHLMLADNLSEVLIDELVYFFFISKIKKYFKVSLPTTLRYLESENADTPIISLVAGIPIESNGNLITSEDVINAFSRVLNKINYLILLNQDVKAYIDVIIAKPIDKELDADLVLGNLTQRVSKLTSAKYPFQNSLITLNVPEGYKTYIFLVVYLDVNSFVNEMNIKQVLEREENRVLAKSLINSIRRQYSVEIEHTVASTLFKTILETLSSIEASLLSKK